MKTYFTGITVPILTPCAHDGRLDEKRFCEHIGFLERADVSGIFIGGTTGEFVNFSAEERMHQLTLACRSTNRLNVLYNITSMNRDEMQRHIDFVGEMGISCVSVTAPIYHKYDNSALVEYFAQVSEMTKGLTLFIYNMPNTTGNPIVTGLLPQLIKDCPNLKGIKDSSMNFTNLQEFYFAAPEGFEVITGNDAEVLASLQLGCRGAIVALANVYPELCVGIHNCYQSGDLETAQLYQKALIRLRQACRATIPVMSHKYLLELRNAPMGEAHFPMRNLKESEKELLRGAFPAAQYMLQHSSVIGGSNAVPDKNK